MRTVLVLALSSALTGSLFLTQNIIAHLNRLTGDHILARTRAGDHIGVSAQADDSTSEKLDQFIRAYVDAHGFNGSVLVASGRTILLDKGYGWRDAARKLPNDGQTRFQIASTTKTFTSTMILRLAAAGELSLSNKLSKWFPELPFADSVTIEQMLTHTSGIWDFTRGEPIAKTDEQKMIAIIRTHPLDFPPGSSWRYSNSNYVLLGFIIGKMMGQPYFEAVRRTIFEPFHMACSGFDFANCPDADKAIGYRTLDDSTAIPDEVTDSSVPAAAGSIYSTVEDLYRWHRSLEDGELLPMAWQDRAYEKYHGNGYGFGWSIDSMAGKRVVSHSGSIPGFGSDFERVPEDDICVVVLSNKAGSTFDVQDISRSLLTILYKQPYTLPKKWTILHLSTEELQTYTGVYEFPQIGLNFRLWVEDGALRLQSANRPGPISTLLPTGNDHFVSKESGDAECWIDRKAGTLTFTQRGRTFSGKKSQ
jgi:CubicO group peptidase (beta-lactamase class C family)